MRFIHQMSRRLATGGEIEATSYGVRFRLDLADHVEAGIFWEAYEVHLIKHWLRFVSPGAIVFDVGANVGLYSLIAAARGGVVHAFEPNPRVAIRLEANLALNDFGSRVRVVRSALSDRSGTATLYDDVNLGKDGANAGVASLSNVNAAGKGVNVRLSTIDEHVETNALARVDLLKLDIQGAEFPALKGAFRTLDQWRPTILMEIDPQCASAMGWSSRDLESYLRSFGYTHLRLDKDNHLFRRGTGLPPPSAVA